MCACGHPLEDHYRISDGVGNWHEPEFCWDPRCPCERYEEVTG